MGRTVAAATLNASTLRRRVFIVDSHVHRVLQRIGFIGGKATPKAASERVTAATAGPTADDLLELFAQLKRLGRPAALRSAGLQRLPAVRLLPDGAAALAPGQACIVGLCVSHRRLHDLRL